MLIAVHGVTGAQGAPVIKTLLERGHRIRAVARTARPDRLPAGVEPVASDLTDVGVLARAYADIDGVALVLPGGATADVATAQAETILAALREAEVPRAVFNAGGGVWKTPPAIPFLQARTRLAFELPEVVQHATVAGPATTLMENFSEGWIVKRLRETGELVNSAPPDVRMNPVAVADLAELMVDVLGEEEPPARVVVHGPGEVTGEEVAAAIASHLDQPVRWTTVSPEEYLEGVARGLGAQYAANIGALYDSHTNVRPPDPPSLEARHITGTTALKHWVEGQSWG